MRKLFNNYKMTIAAFILDAILLNFIQTWWVMIPAALLLGVLMFYERSKAIKDSDETNKQNTLLQLRLKIDSYKHKYGNGCEWVFIEGEELYAGQLKQIEVYSYIIQLRKNNFREDEILELKEMGLLTDNETEWIFKRNISANSKQWIISKKP